MSERDADRPLVLLAGLHRRHRDRVRDFALRAGAPVYAEPLSGLREDPALQPLRLQNERILARGGFNRVIRIGHVPTVRFWRDLDESLRDIPVISYSALPFRGLSRGEMQPIDALPDEPERCERDDELYSRDRDFGSRVEKILDEEQESELSMLRDMALNLPANARVYLGNSLPVREWDLVAPRQQRSFEMEGNRGANGIDGQLSTFFGWCAPGAANVAIIGDLTALYDMNAPWIVPQLDAATGFTIVIVNNGGGRIFSRVPSLRRLSESTREKVIENAHTLSFERWAAMWNLDYQRIEAGKRQEWPGSAGRRVVELMPSLEASRRVWKRYDELWS